MTGWDEADNDQEPLVPAETRPDRSGSLRWAMVWYSVVNLAIGIPLLLFPVAFFELVGVDDAIAAELGAMRWVGAMLVAWAIAALLLVARPEGRAYFVTAGALQMSFGAAALIYSSIVEEQFGALWFHTLITVVFVGTAAFMWVARFRARQAFQAL